MRTGARATPGKRRHLGKIQRLTSPGSPANSLSGEALDDWQDFATNVWMSIDPIRGREFFSSEQIQSSVEVRIGMCYMAGVTPEMRVVHDNVNYNIAAVIDPGERHEELELMCERGANNG